MVVLVLGIWIGAVIKLPTELNNVVQVSGTVSPHNASILYFESLSGTFNTSANVVNGQYSVLLTGGQSYNVFNLPPYAYQENVYKSFYVPSGITTFTENLVPST